MQRIALLSMVAALAACATTDPPESEMAAARAMVAQARPVAQAEAPAQLATAQGTLERAEAAFQRRHYEHARMLALEAEADARLAWTTAENARAQRELQEERSRR